jgi:TPR repeat protein
MPPSNARRAPTIAERLTRQRRDQAEGEKALPLFVRVDGDRADASHSAKHEGAWDVQPVARANPVAAAKAAAGEKLAPSVNIVAANATQSRPLEKSVRHLAIIAIAVALSITAGAVTAQYLIPGPARAPVAPRNSVTTATPQLVAAKPTDPGASSGAKEGSNPSQSGIPAPSAAPASLAALPASPAPAPSVAPPPGSARDTSASATSQPLAPAKPEASTQAKAATPEAAAPMESAPGKIASAAPPPRLGKADVAPSDAKSLAPWLDQRAKNGDAIAQYRLGVLYALGQGVRQDYQHAALLFKAAAEGGVAEAQYNIGVLYERGLGIGRDDVRAAEWYQKAAAQGNANAEFNLGVAYSNGTGVRPSMDQAAHWFRRAAAAGIVNAQFNLGLLYERGDGVPVSQVEAYAWYSAAAGRGDSGAVQRRDRLASLLAPAALKEAKARAEQVAAVIKSGADSAVAGLTTGNSGKAAAPNHE